MKYFASKREKVGFPHVLHKKNVYVFPTRYGWLFIFTLMAMLSGSINYDNNLGFLLTFLLGGMMFVSIFHTFRNLAGMIFMSGSADHVFAGEDTSIRFVLKAPLSERYEVGFSFPGGEGVHCGLLRPDVSNTVEIPFHAAERGVLRLDRLTVSTHYPLGLFRAWSHFHPSIDAVVYPAPLRAAAGEVTGIGGDEENGEKAVIGVDDFQGLNPYRAGDPPNRIYWKTVSRNRGTVIKVFENDVQAAVYFDYDAVPEADRERRLSGLCAMILDAERRLRPYGLKLPGLIIAPGRGDIHKHKCLKALALFPGETEAPDV